LAMAVIGSYCALHVFNSFRVGYMNPFFDIAYFARIAQMPIFAVCFIYFIRDESMKKQVIKGVMCAALIAVTTLVISVISGTYMPTYVGENIGISGWVIDDNRCANSIILVAMSVFAIYVVSQIKNKFLSVAVPTIIFVILLANGTTACYMGLLVIFTGYVAYMVFIRLICGTKIKSILLAALVVLSVASIAVYPYTPRAEISARETEAAKNRQNELELLLAEHGYDISGMSFEEKFNNPGIKAIFEEYYYRMMGYVIPDMFEQFGMDAVLRKYNMTTNGDTLIDIRQMKITYASLIWDECDFLTKLVGFEVSRDCGITGSNDMENDWHALFYYSGYLGFALYIGFVLYFVIIVIKRLIKEFKGSLTMFNCCLLIAFLLMLGLAHFSGAVLRRPNVSIYLSLVMALIYYQTRILPVETKK